MSLWSRIKEGLSGSPAGSPDFTPPGITPDEKDTLSVIRDLSRVVRNNPDAVETYLALGSLFRAKGELERAVQIRESLLVRPELNQAFKARTYFELGKDYRMAGIMDRALQAFNEASRLGVPKAQINAELASLYADSGNWALAVHYNAAVGNKPAEAHYLLRQGLEMLVPDPANPHAPKDTKRAARFMEKALSVYPASPESWSSLVLVQAGEGRWSQAAKTLQKALEKIPADKNFMLFEELLSQHAEATAGSAAWAEFKEFNKNAAEHFLPIINSRQPELAPYYYGAVVLQRCGRAEEAEQWVSKALVIQPDFWLGRLTQLEIARGQYGLPPIVDSDLEFFISQSKKMKRYVCTVCGLHRDVLFYCCPRCHSWHSANYKLTLSE